MANFQDLTTSYKFKWCPGCGNFGILNTLKFMIVQEKMDPTKMVVVSDIGQNGKLPMWLNIYGMHGIHGRALPFAQGVKIANPKLNVIAVLGDGGAYAEGTNHFIHACRRNVDLTCLVHNNATFALTTGQASPTTTKGTVTRTTPEGVLEQELNPLRLALTSGATFIARAFVGDQEHFQKVLTAAVKHKGFAFVDVLQPCVIWNTIQTWQSWRERIYRLEDRRYKTNNLKRAYDLASPTWDKKIPIGIFYRNNKPSFNKQIETKSNLSPVEQKIDQVDIDSLLKNLY